MSTVRIIIAAIISIIVAICLMKFTKVRKQYISVLTIAIILVVTTVLAGVPFENAFVTFSTPEESFNYFHNKKFESQLVIDGEKSSLVIGGENGDYTVQIVPKAEKGWKLARGVDTKVVVNESVDGVAINVFQYKDTQEYYISVVNTNGEEIEISDSYSSEFSSLTYKNISLNNASLNKTIKTYYAYIDNFNEQYFITINGIEIPLNITTE